MTVTRDQLEQQAKEEAEQEAKEEAQKAYDETYADTYEEAYQRILDGLLGEHGFLDGVSRGRHACNKENRVHF